MIELALLKIALRAPDSTIEDDYIAELEAAAVAYVQQATGNTYAAAEDAIAYVVGLGADRLWLSAPFTTPAVLERVNPGDTATTAITDFVVRDGYLLRTGGEVWTLGYEYEVTGDIGYAAGAEPADIRQAVVQLVTHWYELRMPVALEMSIAEVPFSVAELLGTHIHYPIA